MMNYALLYPVWEDIIFWPVAMFLTLCTERTDTQDTNVNTEAVYVTPYQITELKKCRPAAYEEPMVSRQPDIELHVRACPAYTTVEKKEFKDMLNIKLKECPAYEPYYY